MTQSEHKAYKFAQKVQEMIKEKELSKEQINIIISSLLMTNGYEGLADHVAQGYDTRSYDNMFTKGQFDKSGDMGLISFEDLVHAVFHYTGRFSLLGLAKKHRGRSKAYRYDTEGAKKLSFIWLSSHEELGDAKP